MMMGEWPAFFVLVIFIFIHLFANQAHVLGWLWHARFLSFAGGVSFAYVFIDLLPTLEKGQPLLKQVIDPVIPYLDRHSYLIALLGVLFFYGLQGAKGPTYRSFFASIGGFSLFNFFVGASLSDENNPDIQPLALFSIAMGLHYFVHDHNLREGQEVLYDKYGRWILSIALILGWLLGFFVKIPVPIINMVIAFVAGGVLLNVMRYELPKREPGTYKYFLFGALLYTTILLQLKL
jgi:hypothetical protein